MSADKHKSNNICIGGLYEIGVGVRDFAAAIQYFESFGYRVGDIGELLSRDAAALYHHESGLRSVRLLHQDSKDGLIRLMQWDRPLNDGLGLSGHFVPGCRWSVQYTDCVMTISNHFELAHELQNAVKIVPPYFEMLNTAGHPQKPFRDKLTGKRQMATIQPLARQIFIQCFGPAGSHGNNISHGGLMQTSPMWQCGIVSTLEADDLMSFYGSVLGLACLHERSTLSTPASEAVKLLNLLPDRAYTELEFGVLPQEDASDKSIIPGLKIIRTNGESDLATLHQESRPGASGYALYTWRVEHAEKAYEAVRNSAATNLTDIILDEFGQPAFSFTAPDGYFWTLVESKV